ncbi:MAG: M20/M25/M40 family metallo-hydrolase [Chthonomonadales bacterium]
MLDVKQTLQALVEQPSPPGAEEQIREATQKLLEQLGYAYRVDAKGNLLIGSPGPKKIVVTAHLDEIGLMVKRVTNGGMLEVQELGGLYPWKWGEQPVEIMADTPFPGVISFGCIHTNHPGSTVQHARVAPLKWDDAIIYTGISREDVINRGVHPGTRVALGRERRVVTELNDLLVSYFIDDRADIVAMLMLLEMFGGKLPEEVLFAATTSEEVGGEGAQYLLHSLQPDVCIALEIGPLVPESIFQIDDQPTIWVTDGYASTSAADLRLLRRTCASLGMEPHWQPLSRGGSDASCTAAKGLCARPITLGLPVENSHGLEIMHRNAPANLAKLSKALIHNILAE